MADKAPNSYTDPYWADLSAATEERLGLPSGLLSNVVTRGERSNNDQKSEANAATVFQIIPATRKRAIEKYGIDPYLSPENAAEVAGLLLKDSLDRNDGNEAMAVAEYHGGTDRANWGPKTRAYVNRVMSGQREAQRAAPAGQSTFQRVQQAQQPAVSGNAIAQVYDAYKSGQMTPEEASEFEADVNSGVVMLPKGAVLAGQESRAPTEKPAAIELPPEVTDAYQTGKMSEQERADLESDIQAGVVKLSASPTSLPDFQDGQMVQEQPGIIERAPEPTLGQQAQAVGETALATIGGGLAGQIGMAGGTLKGVASQLLNGNFNQGDINGLVEKAAAEGGQAFAAPFQPSSPLGQEYTQATGEALSQLAPVAPMLGEISALAQGTRAAMPAAVATANRVAAPIQGAAQRVQQVAQKLVPGAAAERPAGSTVGAAEVAKADLRREQSQGLPVPVNLTKGAETREPTQLAFEKEQIKSELGGPLRNRAEENNVEVMNNFEELFDRSGAQSADLPTTGNKVIDALSKGWQAAKNETNVAYSKFRKSDEYNAPVDPFKKVSIGSGDNKIEGSVMDYVNSKPVGVPSSAVTDAARQYIKKLGLAKEDADGNLVPSGDKKISVGQMEKLRSELGGVADRASPTQIRDETILKKLIDAQTEPVAGPLAKEARALRTKQARKFENRSVIARLITNRKGMDDPKVAADQVFNKSILNASPEEVTFLKRVMNSSGDDGKQAWKDLQGALLNHIRDEATKGVGLDSQNRPLVSAAKLNQAVSALDKNDRLDIVLGKDNARIVRDLNDVTKYILTVPPGTLINNSGTTGMLLAAMAEAGTTGALTGLPVPVLSGLKAISNAIKSSKMKAKINDALNAKPPVTGKF